MSSHPYLFNTHLSSWWNNSTTSATWGKNTQPSWVIEVRPTILAVHPKLPGHCDHHITATCFIYLPCPSPTLGFPLTTSPTHLFTTPRPCSVFKWCLCPLLDRKCQESHESHHALITAHLHHLQLHILAPIHHGCMVHVPCAQPASSLVPWSASPLAYARICLQEFIFSSMTLHFLSLLSHCPQRANMLLFYHPEKCGSSHTPLLPALTKLYFVVEVLSGASVSDLSWCSA